MGSCSLGLAISLPYFQNQNILTCFLCTFICTLILLNFITFLFVCYHSNTWQHCKQTDNNFKKAIESTGALLLIARTQ